MSSTDCFAQLENPTPFFSVIVATYNCGRTLPTTLKSVQRQTFPNWELVVVDDGSNDETPVLLKEFEALNRGIRRFRIENSGLASARNFGLGVSAGEWILFLDADDLLEPFALEKLLMTIRNTNPEIAMFLTTPFLPEEEPTSRFNQRKIAKYKKYYDRRSEFVAQGPGALLSLLKNRSYLPSACLYTFQSKLIRQTGIAFHDGLEMEDNLFTPLLLASAYRIAVTREKVHRRRLHSESLTARRTICQGQALAFIAKRLAEKALSPSLEKTSKRAFNWLSVDLTMQSIRWIVSAWLAERKILRGATEP